MLRGIREILRADAGISTGLRRPGTPLGFGLKCSPGPRNVAFGMILNLDQSTVANMTAALEYVCKQIRPESDNHETRKAIADAMLASANAGTRSLMQFQEIGIAKLEEITRPKKRIWWRWRRRQARQA